MLHKSNFKPAWWLPGAHLQTMWATLARSQTPLEIHRERLELPDGDFLDLDWAGTGNGPIVIVLHGLGGSIESPYAKGILNALAQCGWRAVFMHFRGCSGTPNRLPRSYHSGETSDVKYVAAWLKQSEPDTPLAAVGFSLGGSVLLKWLNETNSDNPLTAAVAISVPFELAKAANRLQQGVSRVYQWWLLRELRDHVKMKFQQIQAPVDFGNIDTIRTFWEFDEKITAPLHGFTGAYDYYHKASVRPYLRDIHIPTLILHAFDDPFMTPEVIPEQHEMSQQVMLELSASGGHVGFIAGSVPWRPVYWLENRVAEYLKGHLK